MPRMRRGVPEKSKDFTGSIKKLFKSLKKWHITMYIALILALISAILSLIAPNKLSNLTDTITEGIKPNVEVLTQISTNIFTNINNNITDKYTFIISNPNIDENDKIKFQQVMSDIATKENKEEAFLEVFELPNSILFQLMNDFTINDVKINVEDQMKFMSLLTSIDSKNINEESLKQFDQLPSSIYNIVKPTIDMNKVKNIAILLASFYIISAIFSFIENFSMTTISNGYAKFMRQNIIKKVKKLPLKYFDSHETGDLLSRVTNDVDTIAQNLNQSLGTLVGAMTLFSGSILMMFITNWIMALTAMLASLIGFIFMGLILKNSQKYFTMRQEELGKMNGHIEEIYSGHNVVTVYNGVNEAKKQFNELNQNLKESNRKSQFLSGLMMPIMNFIGNFGYVCVCIVGALLVMNNQITFGVIVAFMIYVRMFTNPLSQIAQSMTILQSTAAASERVFEFLDEEEMQDESKLSKKLDKSSVKGNIEFNHVKFGYNKDQMIIKDFNIKVKPGQKVAIVGPTGAGKTTMVNLLMKFYDINDGEILIDGVSTKELTRENIHDLFIMVLQDTWLFDGTIRENIKFNKEDVTDEEIWNACKTVGVEHFIKTLPGGLDARLDDSDTVSQGQKQLMTIARGMIENAPFLILDEATSNVDTRTEELVQKAMDKLTVGRTSFIIAHRLSTIKNADIILVMNEGNIIEQGNHDELIKLNGFYADLYNSQFKK